MNTKAGVLMFILVFYAVCGVFFGFYGDTINDDIALQMRNSDDAQFETSTNWLGKVVENQTGVDKTGFFKDAITGVDNAPTWLNICLFVPLMLVLIYLMLPTY